MRNVEQSKKLHAEAKKCAQSVKREVSALLKALIDIDNDRTYEMFKRPELTPYCVVVLEIDQYLAEVLVRIVRKSHHVPELAQSVLDGKVSFSKAKTIASVITPENKDEWIDRASKETKVKLEKAVAEANGATTKRTVLNLPYETYDKLQRARDFACTNEKRFVTEEETLDIALDEYLEKHDKIRKAQRAVNWSQEHSWTHKVTLRDQEQCGFIYEDGSQCTERKWLHRHHIVHRKDGGPDNPENIITLCSAHHRMVHRGH